MREEAERHRNENSLGSYDFANKARNKQVAALHLTPQSAALGMNAFERGPAMITKIHAYLVKELNSVENSEEKSAEFNNSMCQITLKALWTQNVRGEEVFEMTDCMREGLGAGWTASFLTKIYPGLSRYLMKEFLNAVTELSIVVILALFVTFGAESLVKGPAVMLTEGIQNLRLHGLMTLNAITHGNMGGLINLTRYSEQMRENVMKFYVNRSTDSWNKIRDLRHTLIQYLLQQNRFGAEEEKTIEKKRTCDVMQVACSY